MWVKTDRVDVTFLGLCAPVFIMLIFGTKEKVIIMASGLWMQSLIIFSRNGGTLPRRPGIAARGLKRQAKGLSRWVWVEI